MSITNTKKNKLNTNNKINSNTSITTDMQYIHQQLPQTLPSYPDLHSQRENFPQIFNMPQHHHHQINPPPLHPQHVTSPTSSHFIFHSPFPQSQYQLYSANYTPSGSHTPPLIHHAGVPTLPPHTQQIPQPPPPTLPQHPVLHQHGHYTLPQPAVVPTYLPPSQQSSYFTPPPLPPSSSAPTHLPASVPSNSISTSSVSLSSSFSNNTRNLFSTSSTSPLATNRSQGSLLYEHLLSSSLNSSYHLQPHSLSINSPNTLDQSNKLPPLRNPFAANLPPLTENRIIPPSDSKPRSGIVYESLSYTNKRKDRSSSLSGYTSPFAPKRVKRGDTSPFEGNPANFKKLGSTDSSRLSPTSTITTPAPKTPPQNFLPTVQMQIEKKSDSSDLNNDNNSTSSSGLSSSVESNASLSPDSSITRENGSHQLLTSISTKQSRTQGRPFSNNINARFFLHNDIFSMLNYLDRKKAKSYTVYDFEELELDALDHLSDSNFSSFASTSSQISQGQGKVDSPPNPKGYLDSFKLDTSLSSANSSSKLFKSKQKLNELVGLCNPCEISLVDEISVDPLEIKIVHNQNDLSSSTLHAAHATTVKLEPNASVSPANSVCSSSTSKFLKNILNEDDKRGSKTAKDRDDDVELESKYDKKTTSISNETGCPTQDSSDISYNVHDILKEKFQTSRFSFVKVIRDNLGVVLKLELIPLPHWDNDSEAEIHYTNEWIKKNVCFPRYKSNMKIHLIRVDRKLRNIIKNGLTLSSRKDLKLKQTSPNSPDNSSLHHHQHSKLNIKQGNFCVYNEIKMLLWELNEHSIDLTNNQEGEGNKNKRLIKEMFHDMQVYIRKS